MPEPICREDYKTGTLPPVRPGIIKFPSGHLCILKEVAILVFESQRVSMEPSLVNDDILGSQGGSTVSPCRRESSHRSELTAGAATSSAEVRF